MDDELSRDVDKLVEAAWRAKESSYSPYSRFAVGAAVLTYRGKIYGGCNIENASYGLTICAERVAIQNAISDGEKEILAVAIVSDSDSATPPCGACRQVMFEFRNRSDAGTAKSSDTVVVIEDRARTRSIFTLSELLPNPFSLRASGSRADLT